MQKTHFIGRATSLDWRVLLPSLVAIFVELSIAGIFVQLRVSLVFLKLRDCGERRTCLLLHRAWFGGGSVAAREDVVQIVGEGGFILRFDDARLVDVFWPLCGRILLCVLMLFVEVSLRGVAARGSRRRN